MLVHIPILLKKSSLKMVHEPLRIVQKVLQNGASCKAGRCELNAPDMRFVLQGGGDFPRKFKFPLGFSSKQWYPKHPPTCPILCRLEFVI